MENNRFIKTLLKIAARLSVIAVIIGVVFLFQHYSVWEYLPRNWVVLLHVIGTVVFFGNIIVSAVWMLNANRTEKAMVLNFASNGINRCDKYFIQPGVFVLVVTGLILSIDFGSIYNVGWMTVGVALFSLSGIVWGLFLRRYQNRLVDLSGKTFVVADDEEAGNAQNNEELPNEFYEVLKLWYSWGVVAIILVLGSLSFMSLKPDLW